MTFNLIMDVSLAFFTGVVFLAYCGFWAQRERTLNGVDLIALLPRACLTVALATICLCLFCWAADKPFGLVLAATFCIGTITGLASGNSALGGFAMIGFAFVLVREIAFGLPSLKLAPPTEEIDNRGDSELKGATGRTTTPLNPSGMIELNGVKHTAQSDNGCYIDAGTPVLVTNHKDGVFSVAETQEDEEQITMR